MAGYEHIHKGMTSRDLTENIEQLRAPKASNIQMLTEATLSRLTDLPQQNAALPLTGRTHNVPAQITTMGKRFANIAEEMILAFTTLEQISETYPMRGLKGPVGTQQDLLGLLGDQSKVEELNMPNILVNTPCEALDRSIHDQWISALSAHWFNSQRPGKLS